MEIEFDLLNISKELDSSIYKSSLYEFTLKAFEVMHNGEKPATNWHIEEVCNIIQKEIERIAEGKPKTHDIIINIPPRSLKSFICSICAPAWSWTIDPNIKFVNVSYSADLSTEHNGKTRRLIESDWYINLFPTVKIARGENKKTSFQTEQGGARFATSMLGTITGKGADIIVFDDGLNPKKAGSDAERSATIKAFDETFQSRLNKPQIGLFLIVEQRLHQSDITGHILETRPHKYKRYSFPATDNGQVIPIRYKSKYRSIAQRKEKYLFPSRFTPSFLDDQKINLGSYGYAGQYLQQPSPPEGGLIKKHWFNIVELSEFTTLTRGITWNFYLDTAYTAKSYNDPTAVIVAGIKQNKLFIKRVNEFRLEFPELLKKIPEYCKDNGYTNSSKIIVEPKATGKSAVQILRRHTALNVLEDKAPDTDKIARLSAQTHHIENGRVYLCNGGHVEGFLSQCAAFPNAKHDDQVDVLVMALSRISKSVLPTSG